MGAITSTIDYPLKEELCVAWYLMFGFLIVNAFIKQVIIFRWIHEKRVPFHNTIYQAKQHKKRWAFNTLDDVDKNKYLVEYQELIFHRLSNIFPQEIAFLIIGYYFPNNFVYSKNENESNTVKESITTSDQTEIQSKNPFDSDLNLSQAEKKKREQMAHERKKKGRKNHNTKGLITEKPNTKDAVKKPTKQITPKQIKTHIEISSTNKPQVLRVASHDHEPYIHFTTLKNWCDAEINNVEDDIDREEAIADWRQKTRGRRRRRNNMKQTKFGEQYMIDITQLMNRYYLPQHNTQYQDVAMEASIQEAKDKDHKWRLCETIYVLLKNIMMIITTIIFIFAFIQWSDTQTNNYLRFIGFILLFHHHPAITFVDLMRWVRLSMDWQYAAAPCFSPCYLPLIMWMERNNRESKQHTPKRLYFDHKLKWLSLLNHWIGTYGIWLISLPFVFGGGFWFTHIIWLVYLALGIIVCAFGGCIGFICGKFEFGCARGLDSGMLWVLAFFYHTTGIMYIIGLIFHDRSWPAFVHISTGTYCNDGGIMSLDLSDARVLWVLLSWIL